MYISVVFTAFDPVNNEFAFANGERLVEVKPYGSKVFYLDDHLGSSSVLVNQSGQVVDRTSYQPFGEVKSGGSASKYGYNSKELDGTGLNYYGARYYNPLLKKWTQADTFIEDFYNPQTLNRYSYVRNNPLKYTDPTGHYVSPLDILDYASFADSANNMYNNPSLENAAWLGLDTVFVILPGVGGAGAAGKSLKYLNRADDVADAAKTADIAMDVARETEKTAGAVKKVETVGNVAISTKTWGYTGKKYNTAEKIGELSSRGDYFAGKGYTVKNHFTERLMERKISNEKSLNALQNGQKYLTPKGTYAFVKDGVAVITDGDKSLITVHQVRKISGTWKKL